MTRPLPYGTRSRTTRVRGLAPWDPQPATLDLLAKVQTVLNEYCAYLPMILRQVFYRLVGAYGYPKSERAYDRLGEHLNRARRSGIIPFHAIRDDADVRITLGWDNAGELVDAWRDDVRRFRLNRQQGQPRRNLMMVEARGMKPQIETVYGVAVVGSGGFDSLTAKHQLATLLGSYTATTEVVHIGDRDPSGEHLFASLADDVTALIHDMKLPGKVLFTRLAVTPEQIAVLNLPTAPLKATDRRSFSGDTVQAEAIPPDELTLIVRRALDDRTDRRAFDNTLEREKRIRIDLSMYLQALTDAKYWDDSGAGGMR